MTSNDNHDDADPRGPCSVCGRWPNRSVTVVAVIVRGDQVALIRRGGEPERGKLALPGGYMERDETAVEACARETLEETGLVVRPHTLIGVYDDPARSPAQTVSLAYLVEVAGGALAPGDDAAEAFWWPLSDAPPLTFDHARILADAWALLG